jgi:hypothetical protein
MAVKGLRQQTMMHINSDITITFTTSMEDIELYFYSDPDTTREEM